MNMTKTLVNLVASSLFVVAVAQAQVEINVTTDAPTIDVGDALNVTIDISGLGDFTVDALGLFDFGVSFDPNVLSFNGVTFGDPGLGGSQLDFGSFGSFTDVRPDTGVVELSEFSLEDTDVLNDNQPGAFTLATISFNAIGAGTSGLDIVPTTFFGSSEITLFNADIPGSPLQLASLQGGTVNVNGQSNGGGSVTPTPEPGSLILLSTLLSTGAFYGWRRKEA